MSLWVCDECGTKYAVGLSTCPHCQSTSFHEEDRMPKITAHDGPSDITGTVAPTPEPVTVPGEGSEPAPGPAPADEEAPESTGSPAPEPDSGVEAVDEDTTTTEAVTEDETEVARTDDGTADDGTVTASEPDIERPAVNDSKADWADYAVALGMTRHDAEGYTKRDLIAECDRLAEGAAP
jgi:hypothetical protein